MTCSWIGTCTPMANLFMNQYSLSGHVRSALVANVPHMYISTTTPPVVWGPPVVWRHTRINHSSCSVGVIPGINCSSCGVGVIPGVNRSSCDVGVIPGINHVWDETSLWGFVAQIKFGCHMHSSLMNNYESTCVAGREWCDGKALLVVETVPPHAHLYNMWFFARYLWAKLVIMEMEFGNRCTL